MGKNSCDTTTEIWNKKYRYSGNGDIPGDKTLEDSWLRVAKATASKENDKKNWEGKFLEILEDFKFLPGGRILANAGTSRTAATMFNCYVMNKISDSIDGIFDTVKESALTQKQGGGVGFDFSTIRPAGSPISGCGAASSGPLSFMQVMDSTCRTIMSAGQRRGAQMGVMRCDHPDIYEFITAKRGNNRLQMFNLSVGITEKFMKAVQDNLKWELVFQGEVFKTVHAVELWELIMKSTYDFAEPGFILIDKINEMNNLYYCEDIRATNPCGEQPLPPYGACLLGSLNLTKFVKSPFTKHADINYSELERVTKIAVRMLDNVIDLSLYPLEQQKEEANKKRRMGLGITGLADMFIFMGAHYGSPESLAIAEKVMQTITFAAYEASVEYGMEKGVFPLFDADKYSQSKFVKKLPETLQADIKKHGLRNSHLTSIAPTGTISLLAGNVSSGLEPVFAFSYKRKIRNSHENDTKEIEVADYAFQQYRKFKGNPRLKVKDLPDYFISSSHISPNEHIDIQATLQNYVDSSISKTINVPEDYPFKDFEDIYMKAYKKGLKGCTTFRPSEHITGILINPEEEKKKKEKEEKNAIDISQAAINLVSRPMELEGTTYKIKTPLSADALYVTINDLVSENGKRRPYELFINTKNLQHFSWVVAMTRLVSAVFRHEHDPSFLVKELKSIYDPNGGYFSQGEYIPSLVADIGRVIEQHLVKIGIMEDSKKLKNVSAEATPVEPSPKKNVSQFMICPQCSDRKLISQENCLKCLSCGYSKCG